MLYEWFCRSMLGFFESFRGSLVQKSVLNVAKLCLLVNYYYYLKRVFFCDMAS